MLVTRRRFHALLLGALGGMLVAPTVWADLVEGVDYRLIDPPQPTDAEGQIEVLEFFSYGCPHCGRLNPLIKAWAAQLPADVAFQRVPVSFGRAAWANLARTFYALEYSGDLAKVDDALFDAIGVQRARLFTEADILAWLGSKGVDTEAFAKHWHGFAVETRLARGQTLAERYKIDAVPTIIVGGRYVVVGQNARGYEDLLTIAGQLIDRVRGAG